jgi:hypothetical protein
LGEFGGFREGNMATPVFGTKLVPTGSVSIDAGVNLDTNGLTGDATAFVRRRLGPPSLSNDFLTAFNAAGVEAQSIVRITNVLDAVAAPPNLTWTTRSGAPAMELTVDDPGPGLGQFVLQTDESGVITWHFAKPAGVAGNGARRYLLVRNTLPPAAAGAQPPPGPATQPPPGPATQPPPGPATQPPRAPVRKPALAAEGAKTIQVLRFPWNPLAGIAHLVVSDWERRNRRYRVRKFTPQNYQIDVPQDFTNSDWASVAKSKGPSLLIIHGTYSLSHTDFGRLPSKFVARMNATYGDRVFAFDHPTLTEDPRQNAQWFLDAMPDGTELDLDIICHSRGGLVSRVLTEKFGELSAGARKINVGSLVFIAAPNRGTALTDANRLADYIEAYTNLINFGPAVPSGAASSIKEILEVLVEIAKLLAVGVAPGLSGLESMLPKGPFLTWLNSGSTGKTRYYALASDFEPLTSPGQKDWLEERIDGIFKPDNNDSIVPTDGVWDPAKPSGFPIPKGDSLILPKGQGVDHGGFFQNPASLAKIGAWLGLKP